MILNCGFPQSEKFNVLCYSSAIFQELCELIIWICEFVFNHVVRISIFLFNQNNFVFLGNVYFFLHPLYSMSVMKTNMKVFETYLPKKNSKLFELQN